MRPLPGTIDEVVAAHLCAGCGVCAYLEPEALRMAEVPGIGRRPLPIVATGPGAAVAGLALQACPGRSLAHPPQALDGAPFGGSWGPVLALYECWASDDAVRLRGSSGGVVSAIAAHLVGTGAAHGALQVRARADAPLRNETVLNTTREDILTAAGSRYSPASPCERLDLVEQAPGPCVVVGKPCDIAATASVAAARPRLAEKIAVTIAIFCAWTPSTAATEKVVRSLGVEPGEVERLDYRGDGWPGTFRVRTRQGRTAETTYAESWDGTLTKHRQWRCMICPDHTGEFADLSVGDPWYREIGDDEPGRSLVVVRTERGRKALDSALRSGALAGAPLAMERLRQSQPSLEATRGAVAARVLTMKLVGLPAPRFRNLPSARLWLRLPLAEKSTSILGTLKRAKVRRLYRREPTLDSTGEPGDPLLGGPPGEHLPVPAPPEATSNGPVEVHLVVVTYNSARHLPAFLAAVPAAVAGMSSVRLTVVDNASGDGSPDLVRRLAPWADLVPEAGNLGYAAAINIGMRRADPSIGYLILNPDAILAPGAVQALSQPLAADESIGMTLPRVLDPHGGLQFSLRREPTLPRALAEAVLGGDRGSRHLGEMVQDPDEYVPGATPDWATGAAQLIRASAARAVGDWDERFFLFSEETDYALRLRDAGYRLSFQPAARVVHSGGDMEVSRWLWSLVAINRVRQFATRHSRVAALTFWGVVVLNEAVRSLRRNGIHRTALRTLLGVGPAVLTDASDHRSSRDLALPYASAASRPARRR